MARLPTIRGRVPPGHSAECVTRSPQGSLRSVKSVGRQVGAPLVHQAPALGQLLVEVPASREPLDPTRRPDPILKAGPYCELTFERVSASVWTRRVPADVVDAFLRPGRCLVVGDMPGDPDCFGSAVAWARARQILGLPAEAHVNAPPPLAIAPIIRPGELASADHVSQQAYETVVLVDNDGTRIGPAARAALQRAKRVIVVDHHDVNPTHESLGLGKDTQLVVWKELGADAAALMTLATALRGVEATKAQLTSEGWRDLLAPILAATYSDTRGFEASRSASATIGLVRSIVDAGELDLKEIFAGFDRSIPPAIRRELVGHLKEEPHHEGQFSFATFTLDGQALLEAWSKARQIRATTTWSDLLYAVLDVVEDQTRARGYGAVVFGVETSPQARARLAPELTEQLPPEPVKLSIRSRSPALAPWLARKLGGNGKPHEAGATSDRPLSSILQDAIDHLRTNSRLEQQARLWMRSSPQ